MLRPGMEVWKKEEVETSLAYVYTSFYPQEAEGQLTQYIL